MSSWPPCSFDTGNSALQRGLDHCKQLVGLEGLGHIGMRPNQPTLEAIEDSIAPREYDQPGTLECGSDLDVLDDLVAIKFGEAQIDHYQIRERALLLC